MALRDRLVWTLENRMGGNRSRWSRASDLSRGQVERTLARLAIDPDHSVHWRTLRKLARGAGVSAAWLADGMGDPDDTEAPVDDAAIAEMGPELAAAVAAMRELHRGSTTERAIAEMVARHRVVPGWTRDEWFLQLQAERRRIAGLAPMPEVVPVAKRYLRALDGGAKAEKAEKADKKQPRADD